MEKEGFWVEKEVVGYWIGFDVCYIFNKLGLIIVFLVEFDVLLGIGYVCGYNLFGIYFVLVVSIVK